MGRSFESPFSFTFLGCGAGSFLLSFVFSFSLTVHWAILHAGRSPPLSSHLWTFKLFFSASFSLRMTTRSPQLIGGEKKKSFGAGKAMSGLSTSLPPAPLLPVSCGYHSLGREAPFLCIRSSLCCLLGQEGAHFPSGGVPIFHRSRQEGGGLQSGFFFSFFPVIYFPPGGLSAAAGKIGTSVSRDFGGTRLPPLRLCLSSHVGTGSLRLAQHSVRPLFLFAHFYFP